MQDENKTENTESISQILDRFTKSDRAVVSLPGQGDLLAVPDGVTVIPRENILYPGMSDEPRIGQTFNAHNPNSFSEMVADYAKNETIVYFSRNDYSFHAIINYHGTSRDPEKTVVPGRCDWRISLEFDYSPEWKMLRGAQEAKTEFPDLLNALFALRKTLQFDEVSKRDSLKEDEDIALVDFLDSDDAYAWRDGYAYISEAQLRKAFESSEHIPKPGFLLRLHVPVFDQGVGTDVVLAVRTENAGKFELKVYDQDDAERRSYNAMKVQVKNSLPANIKAYDGHYGDQANLISSSLKDTD